MRGLIIEGARSSASRAAMRLRCRSPRLTACAVAAERSYRVRQVPFVRPSAGLGALSMRAESIDGLGPLPAGLAPYPYRVPRRRLRMRAAAWVSRSIFGVRALNTFVTV